MEMVLKEKIMNHLEENHLIHNSQHGFRQGKSVTSCLLQYWDEVTRYLDDKQPYDTFMGDFAKAFDLVPFKQLLAKVYGHGIRGKVYQWI